MYEERAGGHARRKTKDAFLGPMCVERASERERHGKKREDAREPAVRERLEV
jgi:hypothetical protein